MRRGGRHSRRLSPITTRPLLLGRQGQAVPRRRPPPLDAVAATEPHLKFKAMSLVVVVLVSWGVAFVEYCFAVPANRSQRGLFAGGAQDHPRSDHANHVRRLLPRTISISR